MMIMLENKDDAVPKCFLITYCW